MLSNFRFSLGHIEYYDARLQDGHSNELAVATSEARDMDERRKSLTSVNPLLAKKSELPPTPQVEEVMYEHMALNLPMIAKNALEELAANQASETYGNFENKEDNDQILDEAAEKNNAIGQIMDMLVQQGETLQDELEEELEENDLEEYFDETESDEDFDETEFDEDFDETEFDEDFGETEFDEELDEDEFDEELDEDNE